MNATFSISKIITVESDTEVYNIKFSDFEPEVSKYEQITIKGYFSVAKYNKYIAIVLSLGFKLTKTDYLTFISDTNDVDFRLTYNK